MLQSKIFIDACKECTEGIQNIFFAPNFSMSCVQSLGTTDLLLGHSLYTPQVLPVSLAVLVQNVMINTLHMQIINIILITTQQGKFTPEICLALPVHLYIGVSCPKC